MVRYLFCLIFFITSIKFYAQSKIEQIFIESIEGISSSQFNTVSQQFDISIKVWDPPILQLVPTPFDVGFQLQDLNAHFAYFQSNSNAGNELWIGRLDYSHPLLLVVEVSQNRALDNFEYRECLEEANFQAEEHILAKNISKEKDILKIKKRFRDSCSIYSENAIDSFSWQIEIWEQQENQWKNVSAKIFPALLSNNIVRDVELATVETFHNSLRINYPILSDDMNLGHIRVYLEPQKLIFEYSKDEKIVLLWEQQQLNYWKPRIMD